MRTEAPRRRPERRGREFHGMVSGSAAMFDLFARIERVAASPASVLLRGETGSGKELAARAIHAMSPRAAGPYRPLNCATLLPALGASTLFGHVRGAFTSAVRDQPGLFAVADGGTVFLDEIAELDLELQARLLRVLQERAFVPVGAVTERTADVRLVSATHRSLRDEVLAGRFREDLMYRVRVVPLFIPPLVEREGDLELLLWHLLDRLAPTYGRRIELVASDAHDALHAYGWPGNVRELQNAIEHALVMGEGDTLTLDALPPELRGELPSVTARDLDTAPRGPGSPLDGDGASPPMLVMGRRVASASAISAERIVAALARHAGQRDATARELGISRTKLWRLMREYSLSSRRSTARG